jgi:hypothetical protein
MRKRFEIQYELGVTPIERINIPVKSRDELPPVLRALQYIYITPKLNKKVFDLLESKISTKRKGRLGLSLWEILVLSVVRLTLDANYDRLEHTANYDILVREILGVNKFGDKGKRYPLQTIKDNVSFLDEDTIDEINELVVRAGHAIKKNGEQELEIKVDSYVLESNVHFPTDINLLWDSARKSLDFVEKIVSCSSVSGWRKIEDWRRRIKYSFIRVNRIAFRGGKNKQERVLEAADNYLQITWNLSQKIKISKAELILSTQGSTVRTYFLNQLDYFEKMLDKHIDLVERRIIFGEVIPHSEKLFSLFEPYTEFIKKGKAGNKVELGLKIAVCTDQYGLIVHHRIMEKERDADAALPIARELLRFGVIDSMSFDKGYWRKGNFAGLSELISKVIMPKKGRLNKEEYEREHSMEFKKRRRRHATIESDINCLEHHGLNRCPDKGKDHFRRYAALGILAYNLHRIGNFLIEKDKIELQTAA